MADRKTNLLHALGPGLLWAGTAIGVSHLVQSTRAGAGFGLALMWLVVMANFFKYPGFEAGPRYASATGTSLLEGYRRLGTWALVLFISLTVSTMFTVLAAVTLVTAGMASLLIAGGNPVWWSAGLLGLAAVMLAVGRYKMLDLFMKVMMVILTVSTLATMVMILPTVDVSRLTLWPPVPNVDGPTLIFLCALAGWMPSALDIAVWQSLWGIEKARTDGRPMTVRGALFDFNVGYIGTAVLACVFIFLGAAVLHGSGHTLPNKAPAFAKMLVDVYVSGLGEWARPVILIAVFSTMVSTTLSVTDGFPRALEGAVRRFRSPESGPEDRSALYWGAMAICIAGAMGLIVWTVWYGGSMKTLIDLATILTGVTGGLFGVLNLLVIRRPEVPPEHRPSRLYTAYHIAGIVFMAAMGVLLITGLVMKAYQTPSPSEQQAERP
ncbi:MAG: Mn2+/Fe2+ NRAMP family transporter [Kiritimatiellia bacterium]|jgi:Mn2+/Fe2+ NRAMP family transporter